ncbi:hypothetical protein Dsin_007577 [Dipteronia sinensis]|uniref:Reverse transcriptase domain-containing protein n=1 Tax=Dipteronia sinensis TaxID=43782 RepID=A0AAE0B1R8_9ROSI|nr:hypothetical protein Dsin_007577 [Dipteronia sinensis]
MGFLREFHSNASVVKHLNKTFIAHIPNVSKPETVKDFHPIILVNSLYKVLAKILSNRMKKVMNSVIGETQMAFVKNSHIIDSFVIASEIIHKWKGNSTGGLLVKLDFEKAYDSVDHSFLDSTMKDMGFRFKWRNWISWCISSPSLVVLVNGSPTKEFFVEKGFAKGTRCRISFSIS